MITMFGISNCDTIKKAKKWLETENVEFTFHDYRKQGINSALVETFVSSLGAEQVLNKRGTTYRQLSDADKVNIDDKKAVALLVEHPAMIKRPILLVNNEYHIGFKPEQYEAIFK